MPLTFPIAETARAALDASATARTVGEARDKAGAAVSLVSEWLRPSMSEREALQAQIDVGAAAGFVQIYEDNQGQPVIAVTFWKQGAMRPAPQPPGAAAAPAAPAIHGDTVDDLYFEKAGASARRGGARGRRSRAGDPNQLDLFAGPDQKGLEAPDSGNRAAVIVEEEGSGETFGLAPRPAEPPKAETAVKPPRRPRKSKT